MSTTSQSQQWSGDFGQAYTERNPQSAAEMDKWFIELYGVASTAVFSEFLQGVDRSIHILEVGCNTGAQLEILERSGFKQLTGVDVSKFALERAASRVPSIAFCQASGLSLPFPDLHFDLVYTTGVLIHIAPRDLPKIMSEIVRCSKRYIFGFEYYADKLTEIPYHGHSHLMWKGDYPSLYQQVSSSLTVNMRRKYPYRADSNVDEGFLLQVGPAGA